MVPEPSVSEKIAAILKDPAIIVGLVRAFIILLVTFGINVQQNQQDAILAFVGVLLTVISLGLTGVTYSLTDPKDQT